MTLLGTTERKRAARKWQLRHWPHDLAQAVPLPRPIAPARRSPKRNARADERTKHIGGRPPRLSPLYSKPSSKPWRYWRSRVTVTIGPNAQPPPPPPTPSPNLFRRNCTLALDFSPASPSSPSPPFWAIESSTKALPGKRRPASRSSSNDSDAAGFCEGCL